MEANSVLISAVTAAELAARGGADQIGTGHLGTAAQAGQDLWPFLVYALSVVALLAITLTLARILGARTRHRKSTDLPFESGIVSVGDAEQTRLSIEFYLIAMFFVIFDLETIFIFAWAVAVYDVGWSGYFGVALFVVILLVALVYEWRTGALDWGVLRRRARSAYSQVREAQTSEPAAIQPQERG